MSRARDWLNDNAGGGDTYDGVEFARLGDGVRGTVMEPAFPAVTQYGERLVVNIQTQAGPRSWWVKPGAQAQALDKGLREAGADDLDPGGEIAVVWTDEKDTGKGNAMKLYTVKYKAPARSASTPSSGAEQPPPSEDFFAGLG